MLEVKDIHKSFGNLDVLKGVDLNVDKGDVIAILGPSGSGKTTLMKTLLGLQPPLAGTIRFGEGLTRREIGYLPQQTDLQRDFPALVREIVCSGFQGRCGLRPFYTRAEKAEAHRMLQKVGADHLAGRCYRELAGGQQQRVAFARAIVIEPSCILFDEPLSALDALLREEMRHELKELVSRLGFTAVFVTHDQTEAMSMSDKIAVLDGGVVQQYDTPEEIYHHPATRFVAHFVGKSNWLDATRLFRPEAMTVDPAPGCTEYKLPVQSVQYLGDCYEVQLTYQPDVTWMLHCGRKAAVGETLSVYIDPKQIITVEGVNGK